MREGGARQVHVERLVGLALAVAVDRDRDRRRTGAQLAVAGGVGEGVVPAEPGDGGVGERAVRRERQRAGPLAREAHRVACARQSLDLREVWLDGIGQLKRDELVRYKSPIELVLMQNIKQALDPAGILNPGKFLPSGR